jgi:hypothetical protein
MRTRPRLAAMALVLLAGGEAGAQEITLGASGHLAVSVEHLFGFVHAERSDKQGTITTATFSNTLNLLGTPLGGAVTSYVWPRLALDVFLGRGLSVGGSASYFHGGANLTTGNGDVVQVAPRIGAATMFGPRFGIWPRLALVFDHLSSGPVTESLFALSAEFSFVWVVAPRLMVTVSALTDIPLGGTRTDKAIGSSVPTKVSDLGVEAGVTYCF